MALLRRFFPWLMLGLAVCAIIWAFSFSAIEPADFAFNNGTEVQTIDPPKATGQPDGRVIDALFEGLMQNRPTGEKAGPDGVTPTRPQPAAASEYSVSEDGKTYTFKIRPEAKWSDGRPMTSEDFRWSWQRMLHPETASQYAYQLWYVRGAQAYTEATVNPGDPVEVEIAEGRVREQDNFPRGRIFRGALREVRELPLSSAGEAASKAEDFDKSDALVFVVDVESDELAGETKSMPPTEMQFCRKPEYLADPPADAAPFLHILPDFEKTVGLSAPDASTLVVELKESTPFFLSLTAFYPLFPTQRECIEKYGVPNWTKPERLVCNGAYVLESRAVRDRMRLRKNPEYWGADKVALETIDVFGVQSATTSLNMYETADIAWNTPGGIPLSAIPELENRPDFHAVPQLSVYFYRVNTTRKPYDDPRVRRALNLAIDKQNICDNVAKAGQTPATSIVPPAFKGYQSPPGEAYDPVEAKRLIDEVRAEYAARGEKFPRLEIVYNTNDAHRDIAQVIQNDWKTKLGVDVELRSLEWASYLDAQRTMKYQMARAGWIADYPDPNTFLDMWLKDGGNNETGWSDPRYDELIKLAGKERDPAKRLEHLAEAEAILMKAMPIIPIYYYVSMNMVKPNVRGYYNDVEDRHPLHLMSLDGDAE